MSEINSSDKWEITCVSLADPQDTLGGVAVPPPGGEHTFLSRAACFSALAPAISDLPDGPSFEFFRIESSVQSADYEFPGSFPIKF